MLGFINSLFFIHTTVQKDRRDSFRSFMHLCMFILHMHAIKLEILSLNGEMNKIDES